MALLHWIKGSQLSVYMELREMLNAGDQPSIRLLADRVPYSERTVCRALRGLRSIGVVSMQQKAPGYRASYEIHEENGQWYK